ncbi:MAG: magnesium/cobalt efflux protein [Gammaproteobacteria bacterium]|nr:magnesium/cobalt efflux protein [Gammaproteobacteria bacterium]MAY03546.1 magnesium/cobalt efflux protein [Gammaproteobacteria bacterium]|tara:strand:+ start:223046 stop:223924 length:879 start_codon:yes stop_codon:yes gene_type:complete
MADDQSSNDPGQLSWIDKIKALFGDQPADKRSLIEQMRLAHEAQIIDTEALSIIEGALQVGDMQVREIMIPRSQIATLGTRDSLEEILQIVTGSGHSRFPVSGENSDDIIGILLAKDLIPLLLESSDTKRFNIKDIVREATFIPESKRLNVLLKEFRENRNHMAIVIDEYGGLAGAVTIEDILEQIVGEIEDEHDIDEEDYIKTADGERYIVKAITPLDDFNEYFHSSFSSEDMGTIGGLLLNQFGHIPSRNERIGIGPYVFKILNADGRKIRLIEVSSSLAKEFFDEAEQG